VRVGDKNRPGAPGHSLSRTLTNLSIFIKSSDSKADGIRARGKETWMVLRAPGGAMSHEASLEFPFL